MDEAIEKQPEFGRPFAPSVPLRLGRYRAQDAVEPKGQTNEEIDEDVAREFPLTYWQIIIVVGGKK